MSADPLMETVDRMEQDWEKYLESDSSNDEAKAHLDYLETQEQFWNEVQPISNSEKAEMIGYIEDENYEELKEYIRDGLR